MHYNVPYTDEDRAIILRHHDVTVVCLMMTDDATDYRYMLEREHDKYWAAIQQYELDYVY